MNYVRTARCKSISVYSRLSQCKRPWPIASLLQISPNGVVCRKTFSSSSYFHTWYQQKEYLVVIPDFPNTEKARNKARTGHIRDATPLIDAGIISYFGVTLSDDSVGVESINGSAIVIKAESEAEIEAFLRKDEYTKSGVWNVRDAKIWRFRGG